MDAHLNDEKADEENPDGDLVESPDEVTHHSIVDASPARPARAASTAPSPVRAAATTGGAIRQVGIDQPTPATSSLPAKRSAEKDAGSTSTRRRIASPAPTKTPANSAAVSSSAKSSPARTSKVAGPAATAKGRGRSSARISLEQAVEKVLKLKKTKLTDPFPTVADLVAHLVQFTSAQPNAKRCLKGCRIVFVNTEHWSSAPSTSAKLTRNPMDEGLRTARRSSRPEEFVAPDPSVSPDQLDPDQAEAKGWTTHIVPYVLSQQRLPTYDQILACLGPDEGGISREQLGPFVKVVKYPWVASCIEKRVRADEKPYLIQGDYRRSFLANMTPEQLRRIVEDHKARERAQAEKDEAALQVRRDIRARAGKDALEAYDYERNKRK
ncbi:hypothetical protein RHOSPDRAFT_27126 [Rhodotorula sp. JG-1b]|nr:hypothetical protein RHOSPDRAFT_27126 [Rhodotorula sp. JG-1b]